MTPKGIGIGVSDFKMLRIRNNYYIDKTMYIKDIIDNQSSVILVTRPRRFGKTLNMSMLKYYFDCRQKDSKELFNGLKIMKQDEKYKEKLGKYPVIYLTLKDAGLMTYEMMIMQLKTIMMELFYEHKEMLEGEMSEGERNIFNKILSANATDLDLLNSLKMLSKLMSQYYNKPAILLLDEYDVPLQNAYVEGYYEEAMKFFKNFYGVTFKDNPYLEKTVITGVSRVVKESIFSGANNFKVYTVLDNEFADDFGITEEEMDKIIEDFEIQENKKEIKKWYDGYKIGEVEEIYNPWSILNYLADKKLMPYWVNTSSNDLIKVILKNSSSVKEKMQELLKDKSIEVKINLDTVITGIENNEDNIWGLMLGTGYLKVEEVIDNISKIYKVKLPNYEVKHLFEDIVDDWFRDKVIGNDLKSILKDLITLNLDEYERKFEILVKEMFSYMDVGENTAENFYHAFVLGILVGLKDSYYVNSNRESGIGRYDIMLEPKNQNGNAFIMEFKVYREGKEENIKETIDNAKRQIEEKEYERNLKERGFNNITKMIYVFKGKEVSIEVY